MKYLSFLEKNNKLVTVKRYVRNMKDGTMTPADLMPEDLKGVEKLPYDEQRNCYLVDDFRKFIATEAKLIYISCLTDRCSKSNERDEFTVEYCDDPVDEMYPYIDTRGIKMIGLRKAARCMILGSKLKALYYNKNTYEVWTETATGFDTIVDRYIEDIKDMRPYLSSFYGQPEVIFCGFCETRGMTDGILGKLKYDSKSDEFEFPNPINTTYCPHYSVMQLIADKIYFALNDIDNKLLPEKMKSRFLGCNEETAYDFNNSMWKQLSYHGDIQSMKLKEQRIKQQTQAQITPTIKKEFKDLTKEYKGRGYVDMVLWSEDGDIENAVPAIHFRSQSVEAIFVGIEFESNPKFIRRGYEENCIIYERKNDHWER